jgi:hypothetical protein
MMKEQTLDTGDIVLNYAENDNQGSVLMIIHGIMLSWQDMSGFIEMSVTDISCVRSRSAWSRQVGPLRLRLFPRSLC